MDLRVNYGLDWVESFYEAGHAVQITVTDGEGNVKHTAEAFTEAFEWTPGYFNLDKDAIAWNPSPLDVEPGDWVFAEVDNGATAQVQIGVINGTIDLAADSISGTVEAAWITEPVQIECLDWGSGGDFGNKDGGTILTDGIESYSCSWAGEWNIGPYQNVGIAYIGPDGHWVANAFYQEEEFSGQAQIYTGEGGATPVDSLAAPISRPVYRLMRKPLALLYKQIG